MGRIPRHYYYGLFALVVYIVLFGFPSLQGMLTLMIVVFLLMVALLFIHYQELLPPRVSDLVDRYVIGREPMRSRDLVERRSTRRMELYGAFSTSVLQGNLSEVLIGQTPVTSDIPEKVKNYLSTHERALPLSFLLVGDTDSGKTNLLKKFANELLDSFDEHVSVTVEDDYHRCRQNTTEEELEELLVFDGESDVLIVALDRLDMLGEEQQQSLAEFLSTKVSSNVIMIASVTNTDEAPKDRDHALWISDHTSLSKRLVVNFSRCYLLEPLSDASRAKYLINYLRVHAFDKAGVEIYINDGHEEHIYEFIKDADVHWESVGIDKAKSFLRDGVSKALEFSQGQEIIQVVASSYDRENSTIIFGPAPVRG